MKLKSYFNPNTREAQIRMAADAAPAAPFVALGDIIHEDLDNASGMQKTSINHVIYQHVQERLYLQFKMQDMQIIKITNGGTFRLLTGIEVDRSKTLVKPGEKITITVKPLPANATVDGFFCVPNNPAIVTITSPSAGKFEIVFNGDGETILKVGIKGTNITEQIPVEGRTIVRQA